MCSPTLHRTSAGYLERLSARSVCVVDGLVLCAVSCVGRKLDKVQFLVFLVLHLHIVERYKHIGSFIQDTECLDSDALHRSRVPSVRTARLHVFESDACCAWLKLQLSNASRNSRLLNCAIVVCPTASYIRRLQSVYMRVLRRVCRTCHTDTEIRELMSQPSVDCLLMRASMRHVRRLVVRAPPALCALLGARPRGKLMFWTAPLSADPSCKSGPRLSPVFFHFFLC